MRKNKIQILLLIFITVFTTGLIQPGLLKAEDHDFGEVEIGSTETIPVSITNPAPHPVKITLEFDNTACTDFSVVSAPDLDKPFVGKIEIEVGFTPLKIGSCSNTLTVKGIGIDPNSVNLTGTGIEAISDQPEPFNIGRPYSNQNDEKVTICHIPPGNPDKAKTLSISRAALAAHLAHEEDYLGPCIPTQ
jgi:hypothetical protein